MKILLVHNNYGTHSGEEVVVENLKQIYTSKGYTVGEYRKSSQGITNLGAKIKAFIWGVFPSLSRREFGKTLSEFQPDIIHVHNLYPFIGAAILKQSKQRGVKVIMSVHNYRLMCPNGLFMRNNSPCEECLTKRNEFACIKNNCEKSFAKSLGYALRNMVARKRKYYLNWVDKYCCLTEFMASKLVEAGFDKNKICVIPNSIQPLPTPYKSGDYIGYCGRLSPEKGIDLLLEVAAKHPEITFKFAGSFRDGFAIENPASNCKFLGHLQGEELQEFFTNCSFMVMPSRCYEGFAMSILEAANYGKCIVAPNHGGFSEIIQNQGQALGELFEVNNSEDLEQKIVKLWGNEPLRKLYSQNGKTAILQKYSDEIVASLYQKTIEQL